jgi:hypothetical protein
MTNTFELLDLALQEPRNRIGWFFRREGELMSAIPALFDDDRWGRCDTAIVAALSGEIVGVVTLATNGLERSGRPTVDTLYVSQEHQSNGTGYLLFERGIRWLIGQRPNDRILCQLESSKMVSLVARHGGWLVACHNG